MAPLYYFAYGRYLARAAMQELIPEHKVYGLARLDGFELVFNGDDGQQAYAQANLQTSAKGQVYGLIYELPQSALKRLDQAHANYQREKLPVLIMGLGQAFPVWLFRTTAIHAQAPLLHEVYKIYGAARIIPGYGLKALRTLEHQLAQLKPRYAWSANDLSETC